VESFDLRQLTILAVIVSLSGAGGSLMVRGTSPAPTPSIYPPGVLRDELDRLERRTDQRLDELMRRIRALEVES